MKKILICLLCMVSVVILSGCNTKKEKIESVECSISQDAEQFVLNSSIKMNLKDNKLESSTFVADYILDEEFMQYQDNFKDNLEKEFQTFAKQYGIKYEVVKINDGARITFDMTAEQLGKIYEVDTDDEVTREEIIKEFENSGYTCK